MEGKNLPTAFSGAELSEQSREALKSDTWQKAREVLKNEISETDGETYADVESSGGFTQGAWKEALREYLRTSYKNGGSMCDIESGGAIYKVMKKEDKVTFYDAAGSTLFHISYEQLETEYVQLKGQQGADGENCQIRKQIEESGEEGLQCSGGIGEKCEKCDKAGEAESEDIAKKESVKDNMPENSSNAKESGGSAKGRAKKKLEKELKKAKDKSFAEPVIEYLIKRCGEDEGLSQDVIQEHKTWEKCYDYIYSQAQKSAQKGARSCAVRDDIVCEWAEDYYHKDDKVEEERKAKKAAESKKKAEERKAKAKEEAAKKAAGAKENQDTKALDKTEAVSGGPKKGHAKPKKNTRDMEGQMDMFSMMDI